MHLLTYITRLGSIRSSQGLPYQGSRRAALLHHQMGHFRPWQRSHPSDEHENELAVHHIASHASKPPQLHRRLYNVRSQDRRLEAHPEPQQEDLGSPARLHPSSPRPWRQAQRHPCGRPSGTTNSLSRFEEAQGHRDPGCRAASSSLRAGQGRVAATSPCREKAQDRAQEGRRRCRCLAGCCSGCGSGLCRPSSCSCCSSCRRRQEEASCYPAEEDAGGSRELEQ
jgi:hypothetical protein